MHFMGMIVRPTIPSRYEGESDSVLSSHDSAMCACVPWPSDQPLKDVTQHARYKFVVIEEAQFTTGLKEFVAQELVKGKDIVLVGLHGDYLQRPFNDILSGRPEFLECIAQADDVI